MQFATTHRRDLLLCVDVCDEWVSADRTFTQLTEKMMPVFPNRTDILSYVKSVMLLSENPPLQQNSKII